MGIVRPLSPGLCGHYCNASPNHNTLRTFCGQDLTNVVSRAGAVLFRRHPKSSHTSERRSGFFGDTAGDARGHKSATYHAPQVDHW